MLKHKKSIPTTEELLRADIASRVAPPRVVGEFYIRADGHYAKGKDGHDLRWIDDETEKQLLREMLVSMFKDADLPLPK